MSTKIFKTSYGLWSVAGFFLLYVGCTSKITKEPIPFSEDRKQHLHSFIDSVRVTYRIPGISFAVIHADSLYCDAVGVKDMAGDPLTISSTMLAGSLSEPMLAYTVLKLQEEGKINLNDPVIKYLPYFKMGGDSYQKITIKNLLTHTSGIENYTLFYDNPSYDDNAPEVTTRSIATQVPRWKLPEIQVLRSPYNYDILADLIHKVTQHPFEQYAEKAVFEPLGMRYSSFMKTPESSFPFRTTNYLNYEYDVMEEYPYNRENGGSRGLHIPVEDLSKWMFGLLNQQKESWLNDRPEIFTSAYRTGKNTAIGLGWDIVTDDKGSDIYIKSSEFGGFSNQIILIPSKKIGAVVLANIHNDFNPAKIAGLLVSWLQNKSKLNIKTPIHLLMGNKIKETGDVAQAITAYYALKNSAPGDYDFSEKSILQLGTNLLHHEKKIDKAIDILKFCSKEYPNSATVCLNLAEAYLYNKDLNNCRLQIKKALDMPDNMPEKANFIKYLNERMEILEEKKLSPHS